MASTLSCNKISRILRRIQTTGKYRKLSLPVIFLLAFSVLSCGRQAPQYDGLLIAVSIQPQAWFVSQIAGDKASALVLVPPGQSPHTYEPTPRQLQSLASASAWIRSGLDFEISLLPRIAPLFQNLLIIDGTEGVHFRLLEEHTHAHGGHHHGHGHGSHHHDHSHDTHEGHASHDHGHSHAAHGHSPWEIDRHTWLGREPAKILAAHIRDVLSLLDYENAVFFQERYENLVLEIDAVFDELKDVLAPLYGRSVFVYHPSFGYFFDEFGIQQEAVEMGGTEPTPRQLSDLMDRILEERPAAIFVQTQFPVTAARTLANAVDAELVELDPLASDWLDNIRRLGASLQMAIP